MRRPHPKDPGPATTSVDQLQGTIASLYTTTGQTKITTACSPTTNANRRSTVKEGDEEDNIPMETTHRTDQRCPRTRTTRTESHYNANKSLVQVPFSKQLT